MWYFTQLLNSEKLGTGNTKNARVETARQSVLILAAAIMTDMFFCFSVYLIHTRCNRKVWDFSRHQLYDIPRERMTSSIHQPLAWTRWWTDGCWMWERASSLRAAFCLCVSLPKKMPHSLFHLLGERRLPASSSWNRNFFFSSKVRSLRATGLV